MRRRMPRDTGALIARPAGKDAPVSFDLQAVPLRRLLTTPFRPGGEAASLIIAEIIETIPCNQMGDPSDFGVVLLIEP
jgi:hypothetical protein